MAKEKQTPEKQHQHQKTPPPPKHGIKIWTAVLAVILAFSFMGLTTYQVYTGKIKLPSMIAEKLPPNVTRKTDFGAKFEFVAKYQAPSILMVLLMICNVLRSRSNHMVINPLSGDEDKVQSSKNVLSNTVEQYLLHVFSQIVLINYVDMALVEKIVPLMCLYFFVGRLTFVLGYPKYRTFGFFCTFVPSVTAIGYSFYKFIHAFDLHYFH